ncbi:MAG TPA: rhomboid family intramembrane serine protease GlpG, partial [Psychromonas hadalis]|nr:rhomboid family intramembrane serine protease GlpG [Psychromonas hadalis]
MILCEFQHQRIVQALSDYLNKIGIKNKIEHDGFQFSIHLTDETQHTIALKELQAFVENPNDKKYLSASWETGSTTEQSLGGNHSNYANSHLLSNFFAQGGVMTHSVFLLCVLIFAAMSFGLFEPMNSPLAFFMSTPFDFSQPWRFITPAFLHFSMLHIVFNLLWWWQLGGVVEKQHGKQRLLLILLFAGIASNIAQFYLVSPYFGGLSGVVYALVGYCWLYGQLNKNSRVILPNSMFLFLLAWLALGFVDILPVNVANYAHLVGL